MAPQKIRELAYCTMIRPQVEYAASVWSPWLLQDIYMLERLQCRSARFVSRNYQQIASVGIIIKTLEWESLEDRRKKLRIQMLYKIINDIVLLPSTQVARMEPSCYDLRDLNNQRINPLFCRTDTYKYSFYPQTIELWNNLPL